MNDFIPNADYLKLKESLKSQYKEYTYESTILYNYFNTIFTCNSLYIEIEERDNYKTELLRLFSIWIESKKAAKSLVYIKPKFNTYSDILAFEDLHIKEKINFQKLMCFGNEYVSIKDIDSKMDRYFFVFDKIRELEFLLIWDEKVSWINKTCSELPEDTIQNVAQILSKLSVPHKIVTQLREVEGGFKKIGHFKISSLFYHLQIDKKAQLYEYLWKNRS